MQKSCWIKAVRARLHLFQHILVWITEMKNIAEKSEAMLSLCRHVVSQFHENQASMLWPPLIFCLGKITQKRLDLAARPLLSASPLPDDGKHKVKLVELLVVYTCCSPQGSRKSFTSTYLGSKGIIYFIFLFLNAFHQCRLILCILRQLVCFKYSKPAMSLCK